MAQYLCYTILGLKARWNYKIWKNGHKIWVNKFVGVLQFLWIWEIRDQLYDEKHDIVTIRVVYCCPEKLRDSLCCQGGDSIKSIEIVEPPKPKPAPEKPKVPEKKPEEKPKPQSDSAPAAPPPSAAVPAVIFPETVPVSVLSYPWPVVPVGPFYGAGPCGPPHFYGRPVYDSYGWTGPCYVGPHHECWCEEEEEEEASVCTINWIAPSETRIIMMIIDYI